MGQGSSTWDPLKTVCNIALARGIILGDKMYVDGGVIMDQQNYKFGIDQPYYNSDLLRWPSKSLSHRCSILFNCHFTESDTHISR